VAEHHWPVRGDWWQLKAVVLQRVDVDAPAV
jgi:hypothetical protein